MNTETSCELEQKENVYLKPKISQPNTTNRSFGQDITNLILKPISVDKEDAGNILRLGDYAKEISQNLKNKESENYAV